MSALIRLLTKRNSVQGATGLLVVTLTLSNVLGLLRDRFLAATIPAAQLDSYYAAFRLPDLLTNLIVVGAIAVAFLPLFTEIRTRDQHEGWTAANAILNATVIALLVGSLLLVILMPFLMPLIVPNFPTTKLQQTILLARWLSLTPIFFGVSYLLSGILNSFQRFAVSALSPLVYNLTIIVATIWASHYAIADRVMIVAIGVVVGASAHMLIQIPLAVGLGWRWQPLATIRHSAVQKLRQLMVPRMIGLLAMQLATIVSTAIASSWTGAITYYTLANNIQTMPTVVFAGSLATAVFPSLATLAATKSENQFRDQITRGIRWIIFLLVPAAAGLIILRIQLVRLILGSGFFGWEATQTTADVLGWFAISLVASGLVPLLARVFYARQDMRTPMSIALASALLTMGLAYFLPMILPVTVRFGPHHLIHLGEVASLAIAFSIGMFLNAGLLLSQVVSQFAIDLAPISRTLPKILFATAVMVLAVEATKYVIGTAFGLDRVVWILIQTIAGCLVGVMVYLRLVSWLGVPEWQDLKSFLRQKTSTPTLIALD